MQPDTLPAAPILVDQLHQWIESSTAWRGLVWLDEERFFVSTTQIKNAMPKAIGEAEQEARANQRASGLLSFAEVDRLEEIAEKGYMHLFGRVVMNKQACLQQIERLRAALQHDLEKISSPGSATE